MSAWSRSNSRPANLIDRTIEIAKVLRRGPQAALRPRHAINETDIPQAATTRVRETCVGSFKRLQFDQHPFHAMLCDGMDEPDNVFGLKRARSVRIGAVGHGGIDQARGRE